MNGKKSSEIEDLCMKNGFPLNGAQVRTNNTALDKIARLEGW